jgi:hypothetical protein
MKTVIKALIAVILCLLLALVLLVTERSKTLMIREQGSFAAGGSIITREGGYNPRNPGEEGQTYHGDHAYVFYQVPARARKYPLVFWHGAGQFSKTWETTPDGREGFQTLFLRLRYPVYVIDQPRRGNAGRSTLGTTLQPVADEQYWYETFRIGIWPDYFPGVQFARDSATLNQYFRQMTPNTGPFDLNVVSDAVSKLFSRIGPGVLVTHSQSGGPGWLTAIRNPNVRAVVSYEPGSNFVFPEGEVPEPKSSSGGTLTALGIPREDFLKLTKIPIVLYYGDNIPSVPSGNPGQDFWRVRVEMARLWRDAVNRMGGDVTLVHLPEMGIRGNTHFPFSDLNNREIADVLFNYLKDKGFD